MFLVAWWAVVPLLAQSEASGLTLDPDYSAERLVTEVFATDRCKTIFNVQAIGENQAGIGYFEGQSDIVGFERGIILSTGKITDAAGPNDTRDKGTRLTGPTNDQDLDLVDKNGVFDRSGLEFDFIPLESTVTFRYVFASEEYCEFVGAKFNDIFGFFISGPGYTGTFSNNAVNVARVPGTSSPVTVNSINDEKNKQFFLDNTPTPGGAGSCRGATGNSPRIQTVQFDGQTTVLTATLRVQPCATYHIRLVIADIADDELDSAVFLEGGSFDLGAGAILAGPQGAQEPLIVYEGCEPSTLRISRQPDSKLDRAQTVTYRLGTTSVASDTADFDAGTGRVVIPAGRTFVDVPVRALPDNVTEGDEEAFLLLDLPCACNVDSLRIIVREPTAPRIAEGEPFRYCRGGGSRLSAEIEGGVPPFTYDWSFGSTSPNPEINESLPDTVTLRLTDACGSTVQWRAATEETAPPTVAFPAQDLTACWNQSQEILADLQGNGPFTLSYLIDGERQPDVPLTAGEGWPVDRSGTYQIITVADQTCSSTVDEQLRVDFYKPVLNTSYQDPTCYRAEDGQISATHLPTIEPYAYRLDGEPVVGPQIGNLTEGTYTLTVADALGCSDTSVVVLLDPESIRPVEVECEDLRRPPLSLTARGGVLPYTYSTDGETYRGGEDFWRTVTAGDYYLLRIRDARGCEIEQPEFFLPRAAAFPIVLPSFIPQQVGETTKVELNYRVPPSQLFSYSWQPAELFDCPSCPNPTISAPFTQDVNLIIRDIYGCTDSLTTYVAVDGRKPIYVPNVFSPDGDGNNDFVAVFANADLVQRIVSFQIYTRWGEQVYSDGDYPPNSASRGWNGLLGDRPALPGTYLWVAQVQLYDGQIVRDGGSTVLLAR
ncbi:hypothetical protein LEM8419_01865 [Neolewinella maritima]|uniref:T9SS type B sorting domain-containing protein n=1 Tax=Neolewinella maritima TaxID=1383882 RepID=A0ABN8F1W0_9BACT|nr:hypothetical protein LEM8419_01865 [Neolewinella maritima]